MGSCHWCCRICEMSFDKNEKIIALVDCNSFYCSCEILFRPDLLNRPVGVLSNNDGCFVSRTSELKKLGVAMGAPYFQVKDICEKNNVAVFSANFGLYTDMSQRVMNTLFDFTPSLEIYSVDEAFLDLTGLDEKTIVDYCRKIKEVVERNTGIPVGIGIGRTKVLAKVANRMAKNNEATKGVYSVLDKEAQNLALKSTVIGDVWGIGRQSTIKMKSLGIHTAIQLRDYKNELLIQKLFTKVGRMIQDELKGITCFAFNESTEKKKEIICSRTFGAPVFDLCTLRESIACYASLASEKLRKQKSICNEIEVYIRTNPFKELDQYAKSSSKKLSAPTCDTRKIIKEAWKILDEIYIYGFEYKKALVRISQIQDADEHQLSFLGNNDSPQDLILMKYMDKINKREGHEVLKIAACGTTKDAWFIKHVNKSPRYLTGWSELLKI